MTNEKNFNLDALLQPVSSSEPAGSNIEYEPIYERIRQARISDPDFLPQDEWSTEPRKADWMLVAKQSEEVLVKHSKDLQVVCWLVEAWTQLYQSAGLKGGLALLHRLIDDMWNSCWPALEEEGAEYRYGILLRLDRDISQQLLFKTWLNGPQSSLLWWQKVLSFEHSGAVASEEATEDYGMPAFMLWASKLDPLRVASVAAELDQCRQLIALIEQVYAERHPQAEGRVFFQTDEMLDDLAAFFVRISEQSSERHEQVMMLNVLEPDSSVHSGQSAAEPQQVMSRDLAITQMLTIAHYFRQSEPSSPVPMLMERAARWANMPLSEWLVEMVGDERSLQEINFVLHGPTR